MISFRHLIILLGIFAITLAIRWPHLGRPMGKHHEFCTATALRVLTVWHQEGIASKGFNPATNFHGEVNKHINNHASGSGQMVDAEGNYYYVSHPPLAYYLPYAAFSAIGLEPDVLPLQVLNLFVNLLCGIGIYLLARRLLPDKEWVGLLAAMLYWFAPAVLWFQSNVYMSDMLVQPFFIGALLLVLKLEYQPRAVWMAALGVVCFLATYTTWFGVLMAVSIGVYYLWKSRGAKHYLWVGAVLVFSQLLALGLMAWQYSQIAGWDAYWAELTARHAVRGYQGAKTLMSYLLPNIVINYVANYGFLLLMALVAWAYYRKQPAITRLKVILWLGMAPILLMHLLLPNYTGHDFTTLYLAVPLSIGLAVVAAYLYDTRKEFTLVLAIVGMVSGALLYSLVNPYGERSLNGDYYNQEYTEAQVLLQASTDAVLFVMGRTPSPEALWYAKRNVRQISDEHEALRFLQAHSLNKGVILERGPDGKLESLKSISLLPDLNNIPAHELGK